MSDSVFGIDLGTTYSCIAYMEFNRPTVIPNAGGDLTTPSVVRFDENERIVGKEAKQGSMIFPDETVALVKRHMGKGTFFYFHKGKQITAEEVSSYILKKIVADATLYTNLEIKNVVITCPAYFGILEREATRLAGEIAGLNVLAIINEPTAAAISYGLLDKEDQIVIVYDLGGGTFDVTIARLETNGSFILATGGDDQLGGYNWDTAIVNYFVEKWKEETGSSKDPYESSETIQDLYIKAEDAKQRLTTLNRTDVMVVHDSERARVTLTRETFESLTSGLLNNTINYMRLAIDEAITGGRIKNVTDIKKILLVGGSSKMPQVRSALDAEFPNIEKILYKPDEAVALGAAIYGQKLQIGQAILDHVDPDELEKIAKRMGKPIYEVTTEDLPKPIRDKAQAETADDMGLPFGFIEDSSSRRVVNVASRSFGIIAVDPRTRLPIVANLIRKNDELPCKATQQFGTLEPNQKQADLQIIENFDVRKEIHVFSTESIPSTDQSAVNVREIGLAVMYLPPGTPTGSPIKVTFTLNEHGLLKMHALSVNTGIIVETEIQTEGSITDEQKAKIKQNVSGISIL